MVQPAESKQTHTHKNITKNITSSANEGSKKLTTCSVSLFTIIGCMRSQVVHYKYSETEANACQETFQ